VAILAGDLLLGCRRVLVLAEGLFEAEAINQVDVMTSATKAVRVELKELLSPGVDVAPRAVRIRVDVIFAAGDDSLQLVVPSRSVDRIEDVAFDDRQAATELAIWPVDAMAHDAGHTFSRRRMPIHVAHELGLVEVHAHRGVAADAEVAIRALGQLEDGTVEGVEDRTHLSVGMRRHRPFAVLTGMAGRAGGRGRETILKKELFVLLVGAQRLNLPRLFDPRREAGGRR